MLSGKHLFVYRQSEWNYGDPHACAEQAKAAGVSCVYLKVSDGINAFETGDNLRALAGALRAVGIDVAAWGYWYGPGYYAQSTGKWVPCDLVHARQEGILLAQRALGIGASFVVIDAEGEYEHLGKKADGDPSAAQSESRGITVSLTITRVAA